MNHKFEKETQLIIGKTKDMGIIEYAIHEAEERGMERGVEAKNISVVQKLLLKGTFTLDEIADTAEVSLDFVKGIKRELSL